MLNLKDIAGRAAKQSVATVEPSPALKAAMKPSAQPSARLSYGPDEALQWIESALIQVSDHCDGARSDDGVGFAGQHAFVGNRIADRLNDSGHLNRNDLQWAIKALPLYQKTQLKHLDWNAWIEITEQALIAEKQAYQQRATTNTKALESCPDTYSDCRPYFAQLRQQMVDGKDWEFLKSLQSWSGIHTAKQQPHVVRFVRKYWPEWQESFVHPTNSEASLSPESDSKPDTPSNTTETSNVSTKPQRMNSLADLISSQKSASQSQEPTQSTDNEPVETDSLEPPAPQSNPPVVPTAEPPKSLADLIAMQREQAARDSFQQPSDGPQREAGTEQPGGTDNKSDGTTTDLGSEPVAGLSKAAIQSAIDSALADDPTEIVTALEEIEDEADEADLSEQEVIQLPTTHKPRISWEQLDESQQAAVNGVVTQRYAAWTGAAGTGKTTVQQHVVDRLMQTLPSMNINRYTKEDRELAEKKPARLVGSVLLCAFTGRATQQIKKNFPAAFHANIMTIHKALGFYPEFAEGIDEETGEAYSKRMFVPYYTAENLMPWDAIIIDEASMLGLNLSKQFFDGMKSSCRVYMVGDINQLPPVMDRSVFGFCLNEWPAWELTHIHRQAEDSPIISNAWRILNGEYPVKMPNFEIVTVSADSTECESTLMKYTKAMTKAGLFDQHTDGIIVGMNGNNPNTAGYSIGRIPVNRKLVTFFNPPPKDMKNPDRNDGIRIIVTAGMVRESFAVGDKVMVTVNDNQRGLTNGMLGFITNVSANRDYGLGEFDMQDVNPDDMAAALSGLRSKEMMNVQENRGDGEEEDEEYSKRAASHVITVDFGTDIEGKQIIETFSTTGQVNSLVLAYAFTCHKSQGGEYPTVIIVCHSSQHRVLSREWLYTAVTRAQERVILICNNRGLSQAVNRQNIKGKNLHEKAQRFIEWSGSDIEKSPDLPQPQPIEEKAE